MFMVFRDRYKIGQRMAKTFSTRKRIFLCGDAAHTHSSGAAQGLNTGIHDAVNLGWKLALRIRGLVSEEVLDTYSSERMTAVQRLIDYDRDISTLMSHKWPSWYKGDPGADPYIVLGEIFEQAASFNTGLGISYSENVLNRASTVELSVKPGSRPPDLELSTPGTNQKVRLQRVTRNTAKFQILVFTGNIATTRQALIDLDKFLQGPASKLRSHPVVQWMTVSPAVGCSPYEAIGMTPFGNTYFDPTNTAHEKFGVDMEKGGIVVLRPDGLLASAGPVDGQWVQDYMSRLVSAA